MNSFLTSLFLFLRIAARNIYANWKQSLAAIISVIAGFTAFVIFEGYLRNIYSVYHDFNSQLEMFGDLIIERKGASSPEGRSEPWDFSLSATEQSKIDSFLLKHKEEIITYSRFLFISGSIDSSNATSSFQGLAFDIEQAAQIRNPWSWDTYWGHPLSLIPNPEQKMIIGLRLAQKMGCLSDKLPNLKNYIIDIKKNPTPRKFLCEDEEFQLSAMTESGQINAVDLTVSGILDKGFIERDSKYIAMSLTTAHRLFNTQKVSYYSVLLKPTTSQTNFINQFRNFVDSNTSIMPWEDHPFGVLYKKTLTLLNVIRNFLITIIVSIGSMSVFNTLVKMVKERTQEIGMLRSLGFRPSQIRSLFLLESLLLSWVGCSIGSILCLIFSFIINKLELTYPSGQFSTETEFIIQISPTPYIQGFMLLSFIALFASWIAIRKISRSNVSQLLIHN